MRHKHQPHITHEYLEVRREEMHKDLLQHILKYAKRIEIEDLIRFWEKNEKYFHKVSFNKSIQFPNYLTIPPSLSPPGDSIRIDYDLDLSDAPIMSEIQLIPVANIIKNEIGNRSDEKGESQKNMFALRRKQKMWKVMYKGKETTLLRNTIGLKYVMTLIKNPNKKIPIADLINIVEGQSDTEVIIDKRELPNKKQADYDEKIDMQAKSEYIKRLKQLSEARRNAEATSNERVIEEIDIESRAIKKELSGLKKGGKVYSMNKNLKRGYDKIKKGYDKFLIQINHSETIDLYKHFKNSIKISTTGCCYAPEKDTEWIIDD